MKLRTQTCRELVVLHCCVLVVKDASDAELVCEHEVSLDAAAHQSDVVSLWTDYNNAYRFLTVRVCLRGLRSAQPDRPAAQTRQITGAMEQIRRAAVWASRGRLSWSWQAVTYNSSPMLTRAVWAARTCAERGCRPRRRPDSVWSCCSRVHRLWSWRCLWAGRLRRCNLNVTNVECELRRHKHVPWEWDGSLEPQQLAGLHRADDQVECGDCLVSVSIKSSWLSYSVLRISSVCLLTRSANSCADGMSLLNWQSEVFSQ